MKKPIRVLVVEDSEDDAILMLNELKEGGYDPVFERVETSEAMKAALDQQMWDCVVCDYSMPSFNALAALTLLKESGIDLPFIIVSGTIGEDTAVEAMRAGAHDYIIKGKLQRLVPAIERELRETEVRRERKRAEERLAKLNACLLSFGADPNENINRLVAFCGEQLQATAALYNRLEEDGKLHSLGQWNIPPDFNPVDTPDGHICYDVIRSGGDDVCVIRDLLQTNYAQTDPNVVRYGLRTYIGKAVSFGGTFVGSLCVLYQQDQIPSEDDLNLLGIAATAVGVEEKRKRTEETLKRTYDLLRETGKMAKVGGWELYVESQKLVWSEEVFNIHEVSLDFEPNLNNAIDFYAPEAKPVITQAVQRAIDHGEPFDLELSLITAKGNRIWVHAIGQLQRRDGKTIKVFGTFQDITERKRAEKELVRLRKAVETSGEAIFLADLDGIIIFINPEFTRLYGFTSEEVIGKATPRILKSGKLPPEAYEEFWKTLLNKQVVSGEIINKTKDGRFITVEGSASPILDEEGNLVGFLAIQRDITELKRAEEERRKSEERFRKAIEDIFKFVPEAVLVFTRGLNVYKQNKAFQDIVQKYAQKLDYAEEELADLIIKRVAERLAGSNETEIRIPRKEG